MANITTYLDTGDLLPRINNAIGSLTISRSLASDAADSGDFIQVFTVPVGAKWRITDALLRTSGTLGASATAQLKINRGGTRTNLTAATTAGSAGKVSGAAQTTVPFDAVAGDIIEIAIAGADMSAAATATIDLFYLNRE